MAPFKYQSRADIAGALVFPADPTLHARNLEMVRHLFRLKSLVAVQLIAVEGFLWKFAKHDDFLWCGLK